MPKPKSKLKDQSFKLIISYYTYLFVVWGFYRLLIFQFPAAIEIILIKPLIWLIPLYFILKREHISLRQIGITNQKFFFSIYLALILGVIFTFEGVVINFIKHGARFNFNSVIGPEPFIIALGLSFVTAFTEELAFRGYLFTQTLKFLKNEFAANLLTSFAWSFIHLPIALLDWKLGIGNLLLYLALIFSFAIGSSFIFARTKNITSSIFLHVLWQWPIILYR